MYNELLSISNFEHHFLPLLQQSKVSCAICNKTLPRLWPHLKVHKDFLEPKQNMKQVRKSKREIEMEQLISPDQPIEKWTQRKETLCETYSRLFGPISLINGLINQTLALYSPRSDEWIIMEHLRNIAEWLTISPETKDWEWDFHSNRLNKDRLKEHFQGELTIGVKSRNQHKSRFLVFDIDSVPQWGEINTTVETRAKIVTQAIVKIMRRHKLEPHVIASGGKGYHISLYFRDVIDNRTLKNLFIYFINHPDIPMDNIKIDCLPLSHAVKLPLGIHWGAKKFCGFVDPLTLNPILDPYSYYLEIKPMSINVLNEFIQEQKAKKPHKRKHHLDDSWSLESTETACKLGIESRGTRHYTTLRAAAYMINHEKPESFDDFWELLLRWSQKQYRENSVHIRTGWFEHLKELADIAKYVWENRFTGGIAHKVNISSNDVHWILRLTNDLSTQRLLLAALYQQRIVGGHFYFGFSRMKELTGLAPNPLTYAIHKLRDELSILKIVANYSHHPGLGRSKTTKYCLTEIPERKGIDTILVTITPKTWEVSLWFQLLQMVFTEKQIKKMYPHAHHRILAVFLKHSHSVDIAS